MIEFYFQISSLSNECEKLQQEIVSQNNVDTGYVNIKKNFWKLFFYFTNFFKNFRIKNKAKTTNNIQEVTQREMKLLSRINKRLNDLKYHVNSATDED